MGRRLGRSVTSDRGEDQNARHTDEKENNEPSQNDRAVGVIANGVIPPAASEQ
jgi:hypothetical protein